MLPLSKICQRLDGSCDRVIDGRRIRIERKIWDFMVRIIGLRKAGSLPLRNHR
jgi:hypothetical protein